MLGKNPNSYQMMSHDLQGKMDYSKIPSPGLQLIWWKYTQVRHSSSIIAPSSPVYLSVSGKRAKVKEINKCSRLHTSPLKHLRDYILYTDMCRKTDTNIEQKSATKRQVLRKSYEVFSIHENNRVISQTHKQSHLSNPS